MIQKKLTNIILLGFMGSGKTSLGKLLAQELEFNFLDLDCIIEKNNGLSIKEIFNKFGEEYFRTLEKQEIIKMTSLQVRGIKNCVISLGGGTFCTQENIINLKKIGLTIYLKADFSTLNNRYSEAEISKRPLLQEPEKLSELLKAREFYYSQADLIVETDNMNLTEIKENIKKYLINNLSFYLHKRRIPDKLE